jgi:hypothetical protein
MSDADIEASARAPTDAERVRFEELKQGFKKYQNYTLIGVEDCPHGLRFWVQPTFAPGRYQIIFESERGFACLTR